MKKIISLIGLLVLTVPAFACDESCLKEQAAEKQGKRIPGYLTWKYCDGIKAEFMTVAIRSLEKYRATSMDTKRKRGMKNTNNFLQQRKEWLQECDNYLQLTDHGRLFKDDTTSDKIFASIDSISAELNSLVKGVTYAMDEGQDSTSVAGEKFDHMFKLVDDHKTLLQLKGQFVYRDR